MFTGPNIEYNYASSEPEDLEIGSLKFYYKSWEVDGKVMFKELKSRQCTHDDLITNTGQTNYGFYR